MPALLAALQGWCPGNLSSGWHFQAASFIAGNWEMLWRAGTDGMARRQASGQEARKLQSLELTKMTCPCRIFLDWHFSDGKFLSMFVEEQYSFWTKRTFPAMLDLSPRLVQGQGSLLQWGSMVVSDTDSSTKGTWYSLLRPWKLQETGVVTAFLDYKI